MFSVCNSKESISPARNAARLHVTQVTLLHTGRERFKGATMQFQIGSKFGRWTILSNAGRNKRYQQLVNCICECGTRRTVVEDHLKSGRSTSCNCFRIERSTKAKFKHGEFLGNPKGSPEYHSWAGLKDRCGNPRNKKWKNYGGRGIKVCRRWLESFSNFIEDMGRKPSPAHSIDRKNNDGDYQPDNCRWATPTQQANNQTQNRRITHEGETKTLSQWAKHTGISYGTIQTRLDSGWSIEKSLSTQPRKSTFSSR